MATTNIASWLRSRLLDDGSAAAGIRFTSKHGGHHCWAYWLRHRDLGLAEDSLVVDDGTPIDLHNRDLSAVGRRFNIQIL
ncbi:hypothetical protein [Arthrobacter sp. A5]|uniref:hypothetical protein n=1 Tax=Arthrobacter sp. A5 TaxID=576926 RepID=UPI003DA7C52E